MIKQVRIVGPPWTSNKSTIYSINQFLTIAQLTLFLVGHGSSFNTKNI